MQIVSIKQYTAPHYPDKSAVIADRELLYRLPERWKRYAAAGAALAASIGMLSGCQEKSTPLGGVMMQYPVKLSEDEAIQIINDIVKEEGIEFKKDKNAGVDVLLPSINEKKLHIQLDGVDKIKNIAFEYVSYADCSLWDEHIHSRFDAKASAEKLKEGINSEDREQIIAVFYDELDRSNINKENGKEISRQGLIAQVRDFIQWLKAEKII